MKKLLKILLITILILCLAYCAVSLSIYILDYKKNANSAASAEKTFFEELEKQQASSGTEKETARNPISSAIDLSSLTDLNNEIIGWIVIEDTKISYPICYASVDNSFYLKHNFLKERNSNGAIFIENKNKSDFSDFNTIIYGHSMLNGSMFHDLHEFSDNKFFDSHPTILIYTNDGLKTYTVFARKIIGDSHILSTLNNSDPGSCKAFLNKLYEPGEGSTLRIRESAEVSEKSKIITLSTCMSDNSKRLTVYAVLND